MTKVSRLTITIPPSVKPDLRQVLTYIMRAISDLRERTGGGTDKLGFITITQDVDLDAMETSISGLLTRDLIAGDGLTGGGDGSDDRTFNAVGGLGITVTADEITTNDSQIDHDALSNFVSDEHVAHSGVSIISGNGLTGGGTIASSRTIHVVGGNGITANADDIEIDAAVVIDKSAIPTYTPSNDTTLRAFDANAAAGAISATPTQAEVENIRDAVLGLSDVVATLVKDAGLD